jgi:type I restriction enzyme S subunit
LGCGKKGNNKANIKVSQDNLKYNIPKNWILTSIGEISIIQSGGTPDRKIYNFYNGTIPWVKSGELSYNTIHETEEYITQEALDSSSAKIFPKGSLLIALYGNTVGRMAFLGIDAATNQAVASINSFKINSKYLYYYLMFSKEQLLSKREGSAQSNISQKILDNFSFPLAPISEQNAIVGKIEELFSELDENYQNLIAAKNKTNLTILSILKKSLYNNDWKKIKIAELCEINYGKGLTKNSRLEGNIPVYGSSGIVGYHNMPLTNVPAIIIGRKGSVGQLSYSEISCFPIDTTYYIEESEKFNLKFLYYQLQIKNLSSLNTATTIPGLNREKFYDLDILIPNSVLLIKYIFVSLQKNTQNEMSEMFM